MQKVGQILRVIGLVGLVVWLARWFNIGRPLAPVEIQAGGIQTTDCWGERCVHMYEVSPRFDILCILIVIIMVAMWMVRPTKQGV